MSEAKKSYRELKSELDEVMSSFETSAHEDVDEMLKDYEKASKLIQQLESQLEKAEVSLKKMKPKS